MPSSSLVDLLHKLASALHVAGAQLETGNEDAAAATIETAAHEIRAGLEESK